MRNSFEHDRPNRGSSSADPGGRVPTCRARRRRPASSSTSEPSATNRAVRFSAWSQETVEVVNTSSRRAERGRRRCKWATVLRSVLQRVSQRNVSRGVALSGVAPQENRLIWSQGWNTPVVYSSS